MNKTGTHSFFKATLLAGLLAAGLNAQAAGLGKLVVYSAIGQPLNAEVAISASAEELNSLTAKLASHEAFRDANIDFMPALTGLRFTVVKQAGTPLLKLTSDRPLNEPFLHFLVELNWTSGRMVREYTFLLDPPEMLKLNKPAAVVAPVVSTVSPVRPEPVVTTKPVPAISSPAASAPAVLPKTAPAAGEYQVKQGDTLGKIARETKLDSVTLEQMLVALFNSNRDAFVGDNMNRLRAGKILRVPDAGEISALDKQEARKVVINQAVEFNAYKRRLAEAAGMAPAAPAVAAKESSGKITAKVEDKAPAAPAGDKLQVSRSETAKGAKAGDVTKNLQEDLIAREKALREANSRIADLEKNLENLKKLVELKSQPGTQMQQQAQAAAVPKPAAEAKKPAEEKKPEPQVAAPAPAAPVQEPVKPAAEPAPAKPEEAAALKPAEPTPPPAPVDPKPAEPPKKPAPPPPPPPPEPSFVEENPEIVFGSGGLLALLLGYLGFSAWRKKKAKGESQAAMGAGADVAEPVKSGAVFGAASESVDSGDVSIQGDFSETGILTTEENVDPVAEADVLMAYGRDGQAEEILLEGLKADPAREAIHIKLLELYANRKSSSQFEDIARQLHGLSGGNGPEWDKAVAMARGMGIGGELFGAETTSSEPAPVEVVVQSAAAEDHAATQIIGAVEVAPDVAAAEETADSLEFDLDLGTTSGPAMAAAAEQAAAAPAEEALGLDFDFDLGSTEPVTASAPEVQTESVAEEPVEAVAIVAEEASGNSIDFALDMGEPVADEQAESAPVELPAVDTSSDIDFDIDLGSPDVESVDALPAQAVEPAVEAAPVGNEISFDLDLGEDAPSVDVPAVEMPVALDLSSIDLDLDTPADVAATHEEADVAEIALPDVEMSAEAVSPVLETDFDLALDVGEAEPLSAAGQPEAAEPDNPEVATKLELAQAYEEMGDIEGARELLNEVMSEGSPTQQAAAKARLDLLAG